MIGRTLGNYRIVEQIGMGGMATVFKAFDPDTDRYVALKILPEHYSKDPTFQERFRREARAIARLEHIHILPVHAYGEQDGIAYLVMRLLEAGTLSDRIKRGALPLDEASGVLSQIASALDYAHSQGIIHRDIKPSNILLDRNNNAFLTDFGIAKMVESEALDLTGTGIIGTPQYMSPEQCRGDKNLTAASDIYSLGVVIYEMVTGRTPFQAETPLALIHMQLNEPLPPPRSIRPELTDAIEGVIFKALAKQPEQRFSTCTAMATAFAQAVAAFAQKRAADDQLDRATITPASQPTRASSPMDGETTVLPRKRRVPVWAIVGGVVILVLIGAAMLLSFLSICCAPPPTSIAALVTATPLAAVTEAATTTSATDVPTQAVVVASAEGLSVLEGHTNDVTDVIFSPNGALLASASDDGTVRLWDAGTGAEVATLSGGDEFLSQVEFSPDGTLLASGGANGVRIWDTATHEQVTSFEAYVVNAVAFSPDGTLLASGDNDLDVILWNVESGEKVHVLEGHTSAVQGVAFSPDGTILASTGGWEDGAVRLWDVESGELLHTLDSGTPSVERVAFSADGSRVASGAGDGSIHVWNTNTGEQVAVFDNYSYGVIFNPDGTLMASGTDGGAIALREAETGQILAELEGHTDTTRALAFSPDGAMLASGSEDFTIRLWDVSAYSAREIAVAQETPVTLTPTFANLMARGDFFHNQGDCEQAIDAFTGAIELDGDNALAYFRRGFTYHYCLFDLQQAIADFTRAVELDPLVGNPVNLGHAYFDMGDYENAIPAYTQAIELQTPFVSDAYQFRGHSYDRTGNPEAALADFQAYLEIAGANADPGVVQRVAELEAQTVPSLDDLMAQGDTLAEAGDNDAAIEIFTQAIEAYPESAWAYHNRGWSYYNQGDYDSAISDFEQTLSLDPDYASTYLGLGYTYYDQGDFAQAITNYDALIERDPSAEAYLARGNAHKDLGNHEQAIADYTQALELDEDYLDAYAGLGDAYYDSGRSDEALAAYQQYMERAGDDAADYVTARMAELEAQLATIEIAYVEGGELFYDDFEDGNADGWLLHRSARVTEDETGNHVLRMVSRLGNDYVLAGVGDVGWENYALEFNVQIMNGAVASGHYVIGANVRGDVDRVGCNRYFIGFEEWGSYIERLGEEDECPLVTLVETPDMTVALRDWYTVRIEVYESHLTVYIDGELVLSVDDDEPLSNGYIGLETGRGTTAHFDEVRVIELVPAEGGVQETSGVTAVLTANANLRAGPGVDFPLVRGVPQGEQLTVTGRNARNTWLRVLTASGDIAWVLAERVELRGSLADVPVMNR